MIISKTSEYVLRAATVMALLPKGSTIGTRNLSEEANVPLPYLSKLLKKLVNAKILSVQKGPGGGFSFNKPLKQINILMILESVGFDFNQTHCAFGLSKCNNESPCPLHSSYSKLKQNYFDWAKKTTLQDIVNNSHSE